MKPTSLDALIAASRGSNEPAVIAPGGIWSHTDLRTVSAPAPLGMPPPHGTIVLCCRDPLKVIIGLVRLTGRVDRLALLADDLPCDMVADLASRCGAVTIVTDRPDLVELPGAIAWRKPPSPLKGARIDVSDRSVPTRWIFATSGTTGTPKLVEHDFASLSRPLQTGKDRAWRWGQMYGMARFAGVQLFLQAMAGGVLILPQPDWPLARKLSFLAANVCTAISATPTLWRKILMTPESTALRLQQATLGGEIADATILAALTEAFPQARVTHVYASTEAGASFAIADGRPGFPASMLGQPDREPEIKMVDGRLFIRSAEGRRTYVGSDHAYSDPSGFVDTGDMVEMVGDRCLFRGRANGVINVGGDKVYPQEVEAVILSHPQVALARIYPRSNPFTGQMVAADIVARSDADDPHALARNLQAHCALHLPRWKCPAAIRVVPEMTADSSGKIGRIA